jgi:hypothetical protein
LNKGWQFAFVVNFHRAAKIATGICLNEPVGFSGCGLEAPEHNSGIIPLPSPEKTNIPLYNRLPDAQGAPMPTTGAFKICPFCTEQIRAEAVKCRFCGEWLEDEKHCVPSRASTEKVSEPLGSAAQQGASPSVFRIGPILRDVAILWVLTGLGGIVAGAAGPRQPAESVWTSTGVALSNVLFSIVGFTISGCLAKGNRWKHLAYVALFAWCSGIVNVFFGLPFESWLSGAVVLPLLMGIGGGLSYLIKRRT